MAREAEKKDFQHLTHTWMEEVVKKAIVYNTKKGKKEKKKKDEEKKKEKEKDKKERIEYS